MPAPRRLITLLLAACALVAPAAAGAQTSTGGAAAPTGDEPLIATRHALINGVVSFNGTFAASEAGRAVTVERFDAIAGGWVALTSGSVGADGRWSARSPAVISIVQVRNGKRRRTRFIDSSTEDADAYGPK